MIKLNLCSNPTPDNSDLAQTQSQVSLLRVRLCMNDGWMCGPRMSMMQIYVMMNHIPKTRARCMLLTLYE